MFCKKLKVIFLWHKKTYCTVGILNGTYVIKPPAKKHIVCETIIQKNISYLHVFLPNISDKY